MEFIEFKNVSGNSAVVKAGVCLFRGRKFKCIEKIVDGEREFHRVSEVMKTFEKEIESLGPQVYLIDEKSQKIYLEFIECQTIKEYIEDLDMLSPRSRAQVFFDSLNEFLKKLDEADICHGDLHCENLLICKDMTIRMIDIDTLSRKSKASWCDDLRMLGETIFRAFMERYIEQKDQALALAKENIEEQYQQKHNQIKQKLDILDIDESIKKYLK